MDDQPTLFELPKSTAQVERGLVDRFIVPPFSVLDARQGYWNDRKRFWLSKGIKGEVGRKDGLLFRPGTSSMMNPEYAKKHYGINKLPPGTSVFDPVLTEVMYRWFCPPGGSVLDPFAGGSTRGVVASHLGLHYTGIELRKEQVEANEASVDRSVRPAPRWVLGDSMEIDDLLPESETFDFVLTSPPYYDLEQYSGTTKDGSSIDGAIFGYSVNSYAVFLEWYKKIFAKVFHRLRWNRFLALQVGNFRDSDGALRSFVPSSVRLFEELGFTFYNECILVLPVMTLALRTSFVFPKARKIGRGHQTVPIFYKGMVKEIPENFRPADCEVAVEDASGDDTEGSGVDIGEEPSPAF